MEEKTVVEEYDSCRISVCPAALKTYKDKNSQTDQFIRFIFVTEVPSETVKSTNSICRGELRRGWLTRQQLVWMRRLWELSSLKRRKRRPSRGGSGARWLCGRLGTRSFGLRKVGRCRGRTWRSCSSACPDTPDTSSGGRRCYVILMMSSFYDLFQVRT